MFPQTALPLFKPVQGIEDAVIKRVTVSPFDAALIYVGSDNSLYESRDSGETFQKVAVFKDEEIRHMFFDRQLAGSLYVVTVRHLYKFKNQPEKLFSCADTEVINTAEIQQGKIYIGTSCGVYYALADFLNWQKLGGLGETAVRSIEPIDKGIYLAADKGIYLVKTDDIVERLFVMRESEEEQAVQPNMVTADIWDKRKVWLATTQGIFISEDQGKHWDKLFIQGIDSLCVNCLVQTALERNTIYAGTSRGFLKIDYKDEHAQQIFEGLYSSYVHWAMISSGKIYLATSGGLFTNSYFTPSSDEKSKDILISEPSIEEIQQAALHYNSVHPDRIKKWENRLKYRALFPTVNLDYDKTVTTALGASYDRVQVGPRDWGVSFSWDVGDLVWNSYEDDVDTRGRLVAQLRLDILDEINRVYFERLRLKQEMAGSSLPQDELFNKKLRLEELTAIIDGYTGGYFSRKIREFRQQ